MAEVHGSCHCGAVRITVARTPDYVNVCNCTLCTKSGWRGVYFASDEVEIAGALQSYTRADLPEPMITNFRCAHCGCATHWEPLAAPPHERMGINARLLDESALDGVEVRPINGRAW